MCDSVFLGHCVAVLWAAPDIQHIQPIFRLLPMDLQPLPHTLQASKSSPWTPTESFLPSWETLHFTHLD